MPKTESHRQISSCLTIVLHPDEPDTDTVEGIPDLAGTRWLCFGAAIPCLAFASWLPFAIAPRADQTDARGLVLFLAMVVVCLALVMAAALVRAGLRPGAWFRVGPTGIDYGSGVEGRGDRGVSISWARIVSNPGLTYDIGTAAELYGVAPHARMTFWYRTEDGAVVQRRLSLQLRDDALCCLRFSNGYEVRVALLRRLAAKPGLRFDPDIFVRARVDPVTWEPMSGPHRESWWAAIVTVASMLGFAAFVGDSWSPGWLATGAILIFGGCAVLHVRNWKRAHPRLTQVITFRPPS